MGFFGVSFSFDMNFCGISVRGHMSAHQSIRTFFSSFSWLRNWPGITLFFFFYFTISRFASYIVVMLLHFLKMFFFVFCIVGLLSLMFYFFMFFFIVESLRQVFSMYWLNYEYYICFRHAKGKLFKMFFSTIWL